MNRPDALDGTTRKAKMDCGTAYITINPRADGKGYEVFINIGKAGSCAGALLKAIGRLISLCFKYFVPVSEVSDALQGIHCTAGPIGDISNTPKSCVDYLGWLLNKEDKDDQTVK